MTLGFLVNPWVFPAMLAGEYLVFLAANAGDFYMTNALVKRLGPGIEGNDNVRKMYETQNFAMSDRFLQGTGICYAALMVLMLYFLNRSFTGELSILLLGLLLPALAGSNLLRGAWIFWRLKRTILKG